MRLARCITTFAFLLPASNLLAATCSISGYQFMFGQDTETHMIVKSGTLCGSTFGKVTSHPALAQIGGPTGTVVSEAATNGTASVLSESHWQYVPRRGFVGKDRFVVAISGEMMGRFVQRGTTHLTVEVDVVP